MGHPFADTGCDAFVGKFIEMRAEIQARELQLFAHLRQAAEVHDPSSASHMMRMSQYSGLIARGLGLDCETQEIILCAASLHDIGKLGIPDAILRKRGPLTASEHAASRRHVFHGHSILLHSASPAVRTAAEIALHHHERFNGTGYPDGLAGAQIPLHARIAAVADVFDALTSHRPYRTAISHEDALELILCQSGVQFDPDCVAAFVTEERRVLDIRLRFRDPVLADLTGS